MWRSKASTRIPWPPDIGSYHRRMGPVIHDAVTLRHFAAVERMDVLQACHGHRPEPRWTEGIRAEIESAAQEEESSSAW